jgi:small-conductance mechanosensitive channel
MDDVVIVEGEWGKIEEITLTYVVVNIWDKRRLIVPTTYFIEKPFQNWTKTSSEILGTVFLYTDYTVPFDEIRKELTRILHSTDLWDGQVNNLQVTNSQPQNVEIRALMSAKDSSIAWDLRVYVREKLVTFLQQNYPESLPHTRVMLKNSTPEKIDKA